MAQVEDILKRTRDEYYSMVLERVAQLSDRQCRVALVALVKGERLGTAIRIAEQSKDNEQT